jgi:hypothetical protein
MPFVLLLVREAASSRIARIADRENLGEELDRYGRDSEMQRDPEGVPYCGREIHETIVLRILISASALAKVRDPYDDRSSRSLGRDDDAILIPPFVTNLGAKIGARCAVELDPCAGIPRRLSVALRVIVRRDAVKRRVREDRLRRRLRLYRITIGED